MLQPNQHRRCIPPREGDTKDRQLKGYIKSGRLTKMYPAVGWAIADYSGTDLLSVCSFAHEIVAFPGQLVGGFAAPVAAVNWWDSVVRWLFPVGFCGVMIIDTRHAPEITRAL